MIVTTNRFEVLVKTPSQWQIFSQAKRNESTIASPPLPETPPFAIPNLLGSDWYIRQAGQVKDSQGVGFAHRQQSQRQGQFGPQCLQWNGLGSCEESINSAGLGALSGAGFGDGCWGSSSYVRNSGKWPTLSSYVFLGGWGWRSAENEERSRLRNNGALLAPPKMHGCGGWISNRGMFPAVGCF